MEWDQLNILDMQSLLGSNCCRHLLNVSKIYIWPEEKNQRINEFCIVYIMNPNLYKDKAFKEQVKGCLKNTLGPSTDIHIGKILMKKYKSVSIGYILRE